MYNVLWYKNLAQPFLTPPAWVFAPAWTILYISMLVALFFYAKEKTLIDKSWGIVLFFSQILLNFCWSPIFFYLQNILLALVVVIILDFLVLWNIIEFYRVSKVAAYILIPYFIWILFATYLNIGFLILN